METRPPRSSPRIGQLLDDPKFFEPVVRRIKDQHMAAELAVHATVEEFAGHFAALGNGYLAARSEDSPNWVIAS